ncbi:heme o synthase [candidate division KSB1 bacterium]
MKAKISDYLALTKPTIMLLVLVTGAAGYILEDNSSKGFISFFLVMLGLFLTGGAANALNQIFEKEIDARMSRTRERRPLPSGRLTVFQAFVFTHVIGVTGVLIFAFFFNIMSAMLALGTIVFYAFFYTLYLKPNTPQNIVIGGAAGAMGPVIAWAAMAGSISVTPIILFLIIFFWTPPHFWALALYYKDDYDKADLPMMPNIKGDDFTLNLIVLHTTILFAVTIVLYFYNLSLLYLAAAIVLGSIFLYKSYAAKSGKQKGQYLKLFGFSIVHLFALFIIMLFDGIFLI